VGTVFSEDTVYKVKQAADIVEVISMYLPLKKAGRYYKCACPFHGEENPSFTVNPDRQIFRCYGCQEGGDVIAFLMKYQNLSFMEAVRELAERYNVTLPSERPGSQKERKETKSLKESVYRVNALAARFYRERLASPQGKAARDYLQRRKLDGEIAGRFSLGWAPEGWDNLLSFLRGKNVPTDLAEKAGLILPGRKGGFYDRFRARLMFPIVDLQDRVIGFGGRTLGDDTPKYLNSPETVVYHKGGSLYGLRNAQAAARSEGRLLLVEGYMDALALVNHGLENTAATLGTALTQEQLRLVKRAATTVVASFDSDEAGQKAVLRNAPLFFRESLNVSVLVLSSGDDPDDFINREGKEAFLRKIEEAPALSDFCLDILLRQGADTISGQTAALEGFKTVFQAMRNELEKNRCVKILSERMRRDETVVGRILASGRPAERVLRRSDPANANASERYVLEFYLRHPEVGEALHNAGIAEHFDDQQLAGILREALTDCREGDTVDYDRLMIRFNEPQIHRLIADMIFSGEERKEDDVESILKDILNTFRRKGLQKRAEELGAKIEAAEKENNMELLQVLLMQKEKLIKQKAVIQ
jgi:DNA primase